MDIEAIKEDVRLLMSADGSGHGFDHIERVYCLAMKLAAEEKADRDLAALGALLHDADDYKLFGQDYADNLTNAREIMERNGVSAGQQEKVCDIIRNMGYSKSLKGIRPKTLEGQIVSDADMLDAIGALGTVRCLAYALSRCNEAGDPVFDPQVFPDLNLTMEEYKKPNRKSDNFINHFFEKMLKLKGMMFTDAARKEAEIRHRFMLGFLYEFFREQDLSDWIAYLEDYERSANAA